MRNRATAIGCVALALWSSLALLTTAAGAVPPFQLTAMTFALAALLAIGKWLLRGEDPRVHLRLPIAAWALGIGGLFGYHALYFAAFARAPAVDVNLIAYLWPLLVVLFAGMPPRELQLAFGRRLRSDRHRRGRRFTRRPQRNTMRGNAT